MKVANINSLTRRIMPLILINAALVAQSTDFTTIFSTTSMSDWTTEGNIASTTIDSTLGFVFSFNETNPPKARPDTVIMDLNPSIDLSNCTSAFIYYDTKGVLPNSESWVIPTVKTFIKHENDPYWTEVYTKELTHLAGWVSELNLRLKIAVRTDLVYPGEFQLYNFKVHGQCNP